MNALARTLASEEEGRVAVWAIRPGVVDTDMQADLRANGLSLGMDKPSVDKFIGLHRDGKLVKVEDPSHVLAALAVRGSLDEPKTKEGGAAGREGAFLSWDEDVLAPFRRQ